MEDDTLIFMGDAVKALPDGKVGGYLVRFSSDNDPDATGDFFSKSTDLGEPVRLPVLYHHGFDTKMGRKRIGTGETRVDDVGLWIEAQLSLRDEYERKIYEMAKAGQLGWSSGAASHAVERETAGKASHITQWYIAEASLTPTPAEWRNVAMPIKSLIPATPSGDGDTNQPLILGESKMSEELNIQAIVEQAAAKAVEAYVAAQPEVKAGYVQVVEDETDKAVKSGEAWKSAGHFFKAVYEAAVSPHSVDKRLLAGKAAEIKATGHSESVPSDGGFLVPPQYSGGIREKMFETGRLLSLINPMTISGNTMVFNALDENSRVDGARNGGILGYWLQEGGTKTASQSKFRQIELRLKKVAALSVATDELLQDAAALGSWLPGKMAEELRFQVENSFINGNGVGKPLGVLNSGSLVSAVRTDASEIDSLDIGRMWARRWVGANDYVWLASPDIFPQLLQLTVGTIPAYMPAGGFSGAQYGTIFGRPVIETEYNPTLGQVGDLLLMSPSAYLAIQGGGVEQASSIHVYFSTDETAFRSVYRVDGQPEWNAALTPFKGSLTKSPFVALAAST